MVGSSRMVCREVGIGRFCWASCCDIGVIGLIISISSWLRPPCFWRFFSPFWMIWSISYLAIRHRSSGPLIVKIFFALSWISSLLRHTKAPVFVFIPFIHFPAIVFGIAYLVYSYYMAKKDSDNIGHDAHFFGALFGIMFTIILNKKRINRS